MDETGIDQALTCSLRGFLYSFKEGNDQTKKVCDESGGRFIPVATINPQTYFGVIEEVDRIVDGGFRIVRFFPTEQEWSITQKHFSRLLDKIAGTNLALMIPSTEGITTIADVTSGLDNAVIIETIRAYPHLAEMIISAQESRNLHIETHLIGGMEYPETLVREIGRDQIIFGSGAPLHCISAALLPVQNAQLDEETKALVLGGNIRRILGL